MRSVYINRMKEEKTIFKPSNVCIQLKIWAEKMKILNVEIKDIISRTKITFFKTHF